MKSEDTKSLINCMKYLIALNSQKMLISFKLSKDAYKQYEKAIIDYRENELDNFRMRRTHLVGQKNYLI